MPAPSNPYQMPEVGLPRPATPPRRTIWVTAGVALSVCLGILHILFILQFTRNVAGMIGDDYLVKYVVSDLGLIALVVLLTTPLYVVSSRYFLRRRCWRGWLVIALTIGFLFLVLFACATAAQRRAPTEVVPGETRV